MRLAKARVRNYRSIRDTDWFDVEKTKTIMVGPNEAGKTAVLQALQQLSPPKGTPGFDALRDYPRAIYNDITTKRVDPSKEKIVEGHFLLDPADVEAIDPEFKNCIYVLYKHLDNKLYHHLIEAPEVPKYADVKKDLARLCAHIDARVPQPEQGKAAGELPSGSLASIIKEWQDHTSINTERGVSLKNWLEKHYPLIDEGNETEEKRYNELLRLSSIDVRREAVLKELASRLPVFVLFSNYFRVRPLIHLEHLAQRLDSNVLDDDQYDYGNQCLLKLLGFSARELSNLGRAAEPNAKDPDALKRYRDQLDKRSYQLNAASVRLTDEIVSVWAPDHKRQEAAKLHVRADGQYLKVLVEDDVGVEIELHQRSEGFQWLVSFFVVFFAEAQDKYENAVLLLDEPGLSLHGLKQREFRSTVSRLAEKNQTIYTTHSPFLVGPDELDLVRVVEMTDRKVGTKVHTTITANDPAGLLPLQEALGYDLAQSLFAQQRNLVLEGLTDYWYLDATAELLQSSGECVLTESIALVPAASAGKVVYYATILFAQKLKVAALLDSDAAGDQAAKQDTLVHTLGNKRILRTKDVYTGAVTKPEVEDLLRETLLSVAKSELGWDVANTANSQPQRALVDIFSAEIKGFSKYVLAKAYLRWARTAKAKDLTADERKQWCALVDLINKALK